MKELEKKFRKKSVSAAIACLVIGLLLTVYSFFDYLHFGDVQDLDYIDPAQITEGQGKVTVYDVYDYYSYWTDSTGKEVTRDYFVAIGDGDHVVYMGCELTGRKNTRAYNLMETLWELEETEDEIDYSTLDYFTVKGKIKAISGDDLTYFNDFLNDMSDYYGMSRAELDEYFIPYVIVAPTISGDGGSMSYIIAIVGIGCLVAAVIIMMSALFGNTLKDIKKFCKNKSNAEMEMARIERFYLTTPERYGIRVSDEYFLFEGGMKPQIFDTKDVIWFYQYIVTRKSYFVTVGKDYYVRFRTADGKMVQCATKKDEIDQVIHYFMGVMPDSIVGYSDSLENMYRNNRAQMIAEVERRHEARTGHACMHEDNECYTQE